jgi:asparagine synthase (glutamine-hydrolysing)
LLKGHPLSFAVFQQAPWYQHGLLSLEQTQLSIRSPFLDNDLVRTLFRAPQSVGANDVSPRLIADGNPALARIPSDRGPIPRGGVWGEAVRGLIDYTVKAEYTYDYGMPQWLARTDHFLSPLHLERLFLGRHKFSHFRVWYRDTLASYVEGMLLDPRSLSRPYLQSKTLESMVHGHLRGDSNYTLEIHKVLTLELLHRLFIDM